MSLGRSNWWGMVLCLWGGTGLGGVMLSGDLVSSTYTFRPFQTEATRAHGALGLGIGLGYKAGKYWDLRGFTDLEFGTANKLIEPQQRFVTLGGESSVIFGGLVPVGLRFGQRWVTDTESGSGSFGAKSGFYSGFFIGSSYEVNGKNSVTVRFQWSQTYLKELADLQDLGNPKKGILDQLSLTVGWHRMLVEGHQVQSLIFNSIL